MLAFRAPRPNEDLHIEAGRRSPDQARRAGLPRWHRGRLRILLLQYLDRQSLQVDGLVRTYWTPPDPLVESVATTLSDPPPLLIALHGLNSSGSRLAWWSGLDHRGPLAGFRCVFPDAMRTVWDDHGCGRVDGADDPGFIAALIDYFVQTGQADARHVVLTGVSSGATFASVARTGAIAVDGLASVNGTARVASRTVPQPDRRREYGRATDRRDR